MRTRFDAIMASFPDEPINTARAAEISFLLSNAQFDEQLARRGTRENAQ
jgi:hypothetical protein